MRTPFGLNNWFEAAGKASSLLVLGLTVAVANSLPAASPTPVTLRPGPPDSDGQTSFFLEWTGTSNAYYKIQSRPTLYPATPWETIDLVSSSSSRGSFQILPDRSESSRFFRLVLPQPEIFRVEPAVAPLSGGTLYILGQSLETNGQVRIGEATLSPQVIEPGSVYRVTVPPLAEGSYDVEWLENGQVVASKYKLYSSTAEVQPVGIKHRLLEVPEDPPASPFPTESGANRQYVGTVTIVKRSVPNAGTDPGVATGDSIALMPSGEIQLQATDLVIPGRGLDFKWVRTYRSRTGTSTPMGVRWDHGYNLFVQRDPSGIAVFNGTGRRDLYFPGTNGMFGVHSRNESFNEVVEMPSSGMVIVKFPSSGQWVFNRMDGSATSGKISLIMDRNLNRLAFNYDAQGRLIQVIDTHGRTNRVDYNAQGFIQSVTDFSGRALTYRYHDLGSAGGTVGDLASFTTPPVTGTPNTNDFPGGKTTTYTYSVGFGDDRENHLLLAITDPKRQVPYRFVYQHNQTDLDFLRIRSIQAGASNNLTFISYLAQTPSPSNRYAVLKTIVNDPIGNVTETWYDSQNRPVIERDLAARAVAGLPVTENENRPVKKLRDADPDYWQRERGWNIDNLSREIIHPGGNRETFVYERDFDANASTRKKGDLRVSREQACCVGDVGGDGVPDLVTRYTYHTNFGSPATKLMKGRHTRTWGNHIDQDIVSRKGWDGYISSSLLHGVSRGPRQSTSLEGTFSHRVIDPRGNSDVFTHDLRGNLLQHEGPLLDGQVRPVMNFEYNTFGQVTAQVDAANGSGHRRRDEYFYYQSGARMGYLSHVSYNRTDPSFRATNFFDYDAVGNVTQLIDPRGFETVFTYNSLNQVVKQDQEQVRALDGNPSLRVASFFTYDANDNVSLTELENRNSDGVLDSANPTWETTAQYDQLNRLRLLGHEITHVVQQGTHRFASNRFDYDANNNLIRAHSPEAVNGNDTNNLVTFEYDTRGLLFQRFRAPGTLAQSVERWDYTPNGRKSTQWEPHKSPGLDSPEMARTTYQYDDFDRCIRLRDAMGNETHWTYDPNGNIRSQLTLGAPEDVLPTPEGNVRLAEMFFDWDSHDRLTRSQVSWFDIFTEETRPATHFRYAANGQLISDTDGNGNTTQYAYDTMNRFSSITDAKTNTVTYGYDAAGNVISQTEADRSDLGGPEQRFSITRVYDGLNRVIRSMDNLSNTVSYAYDSRGNLVSEVDPRGNESVHTHDGLSRLVQSDFYTASRPGGVIFTTRNLGYDSQRLISDTDHHGNTTRYFHDSLDRPVRKRHADGTENTFKYDERDNLLESTDPNGTLVQNSYDLLNRCLAKLITVGSGVANTTTAETFSYDGLSRMVGGANNVMSNRLIWDSRSQLARQTAGALTLGSTFDSVGNRVSVNYPGGLAMVNTYDSLNRVASKSQNLAAQGALKPIANISYEGPDRLVRIARGNGVNTRINFEGSEGASSSSFGWKQPARMNHAMASLGRVVDQRLFTYDRAQNKTERAMTAGFTQGGPMTTNKFTYDSLNRLTRGTTSRSMGVVADSVYGLDALGNRTNVIRTGSLDVYRMDPALPEPADFQMNQYTVTPIGTQVYDRNGNLTSVSTAGGSTQYQYDYADRLISVDVSAGPAVVPVARYAYDVLGRRISKTTFPPAPLAPVVTEYFYDGSRMIEQRVAGRLTRSFYAPPQIGDEVLVSFSPTGETFYHLADDLGNALALADDQGNVLERYDYDDFGEPQFLNADGGPLTGADGTAVSESAHGNPFLFHGMYWDPETRYYFGHSQGANSGFRWTAELYVEDSRRPAKDYSTDPYVETAMRYYQTRNGEFHRGAPTKINLQGVLRQRDRAFADNNPWTGGTPVYMKKGTVKFFNDAKSFGRVFFQVPRPGSFKSKEYSLTSARGGKLTSVGKPKRSSDSRLGGVAKGVAQVGLGVAANRTTDVTGEIELPDGRRYGATGHPTPVIHGHGTGGSCKLFSVTGQPTPVGRSTITGIEMFRKLLDHGEAGGDVDSTSDRSRTLRSIDTLLFVPLLNK